MQHILTLINLILIFLLFVFLYFMIMRVFFSNEIPSGLLPIREIKHQIDLVSAVAIPN
jgi:hypothetical protein